MSGLPGRLLLLCWGLCAALFAGTSGATGTIRPFPGLEQLKSYPASAIRRGSLNGYSIGPQPTVHPQPDLQQYYALPDAFIEVTEENLDTRVSEHFTLGQFLCKQESTYPKYIVLQPSLLELLERLVQELQHNGYPVETLGVISGYRTPAYNKHIGNVVNSRHVYGDALDLFVDMDGDGRMDDLNGDGLNNREDVDTLYELIDRFRRRPENAALIGGVGRYYPNVRHGGFVHVDTRGFRARW